MTYALPAPREEFDDSEIVIASHLGKDDDATLLTIGDSEPLYSVIGLVRIDEDDFEIDWVRNFGNIETAAHEYMVEAYGLEQQSPESKFEQQILDEGR